MLKRIITHLIAFFAGVYWYDTIANTEIFKNTPSEELPGASRGNLANSARLGKAAGLEIADKLGFKSD